MSRTHPLALLVLIALVLCSLAAYLVPGAVRALPSASSPIDARAAGPHGSRGESASLALVVPGSGSAPRSAVGGRPQGVGVLLEGRPLAQNAQGVLFARAAGVSAATPARRCDVQGPWADLAGADATQLGPVAALIDGRPYRWRWVSEGNERSVELLPATSILLEVLDAQGLDAGAVEAVEQRALEYLGRVGAAHPGLLSAPDLLVAGQGSPVWIDPQALLVPGARLWVRAQGASFGQLALHERQGHAALRLEPGGTLQVSLDGLRETAGHRLELVRDGVVYTSLDALPSVPFSLQGVEVGRFEGRLVRAAGEGEVLDSREVDVLASSTASLRLGLDRREALDLGQLRIELSLPSSSPGDELDPNACVLALHHDVDAELVPLPRTRPRQIRLDRMTPLLGAGRRLLMDLDGVPAGGYRVELAPFGLQAEAWVGPGDSATIGIEVPELVRTRVVFRDRDSGEACTVRVGAIEALSAAHGAITAVNVRWRRLTTPRPGVEFTAVPGTYCVRVHDPVYGHLVSEVEVEPGRGTIEIDVQEASWIDLTLQPWAGGEVRRADPEWWEGIEVLQGGGAAPVLVREYPFDPRIDPIDDPQARAMSLCVAGAGPLLLRLPPQGPGARRLDILVPPAQRDPGGTTPWRRRALVLEGP